MIGPNYTGLMVGAWPGQEPVPEFDVSALSDSWPLRYSAELSALVVGITPIAATPDTWTLTLDDARHGEVLDIPNWYTDLTPGIFPWHPPALTAKIGPLLLPILPSDTWFLTWAETPVDTVQFDLFDFWSLRYSNELAAITTSQTFPLNEFWSLSFAEASQLATTNAELDLALNDPWGIRWNEVSSMFEDNPLADNWAITYSAEVLQPLNVAAISDTWSLSYATETSAVISDVPIAQTVSDTWSLSWLDASALVANLFPATTDTWRITYAPETAAVATSGVFPIADTWSLLWVEAPADVQPTPVFADLADGWRLAYQFEVATVSNIPTIGILGSDQWSLTFAESTHIFSSLIQVPPGRLINVGGTKRKVIKVE